MRGQLQRQQQQQNRAVERKTSFCFQKLSSRGLREFNNRQHAVVRAALKQKSNDNNEPPGDAKLAKTEGRKPNEKLEEIYIGFEKGYNNTRTNTKGRIILDDPRKYPTKVDIGFFQGISGGWAGGEVAIQDTVAEGMVERKKGVLEPKADSTTLNKPKPKKGEELIYIGYEKGDYAKRNAGQKGRLIADDPRKYPGKDDVGGLQGIAGGFAGGERGVVRYLEAGEIKIREPNVGPPVRQFSIVNIVGILIVAGAGGGLLLTDAIDLGEGFLKKDVLDAALDASNKKYYIAALGLLGGVGAFAGGRALAFTIRDRLQSGVLQVRQLVVSLVFWATVFIAARAILEV